MDHFRSINATAAARPTPTTDIDTAVSKLRLLEESEEEGGGTPECPCDARRRLDCGMDR
eukprot:m.122393 g.122393  ORF g.122393 m.122393 type:complete len:59 (+) comp13730_c0_seq1:380-556(+)